MKMLVYDKTVPIEKIPERDFELLRTKKCQLSEDSEKDDNIDSSQ
jgi:hypothetical protein